MNDNSPWLGAQPVRRDWQASTELFPKDFSRFVLPQNLDQLMDGTNAHTFRTYDEFIRFIEPVAPAPPARKTSGMATSWSVLAATCAVISVIAIAAGAVIPNLDAVLAGIGAAFAAFVFGLVAMGQQMIISSAQKRQLPPQQRLIQKFGGEPAAALPVFIVDRLTMTAEENDVLDQSLGMYNYCQANRLPLSADHWRALTQQALAQTRFARHNGEPEALADLRANIERLEL